MLSVFITILYFILETPQTIPLPIAMSEVNAYGQATSLFTQHGLVVVLVESCV